MLTQSHLKSILSYDPITGNFTRLKNLNHNAIAGDIAGWVWPSSRGREYIRITIFGADYGAHRLAFLYMEGELPPEQVDHINGNSKDNSWANIRKVSPLDNSRNCKLGCNNSSGISDVTFRSDSNKWRVRISDNGKRIALGCFDNIFDAACARKSAELKYNYHPNHGTDRPL